MPHSREQSRRHKKQKKAASIKAGKCSTCHKRKPVAGTKTCQRCRDNNKRYRDKNITKGLCRCGKRPPEPGFKCCRECTVRARGYNRLKRHNCIVAYGGYECKCCGETTPEFLQIDHINNDGAKHREEIGNGSRIYDWLKKNNYPPGFQVLCANCNYAKAHYGYCPHHRDKDVNHAPRQRRDHPSIVCTPRQRGAAIPPPVVLEDELEHLFDC